MALTWIQNTRTQMSNIRQLQNALLARPDMRAALNRYVARLDLQGQINRGTLTEQQALALFQRAIQQFSHTINQEMNQRFTPAVIEQNNLTNSLNMQQALDNPNSFASQQMNDLAASIVTAIDEEFSINEQVQIQQQIENEQVTQVPAQQEEEATPTPEPTSHEKEEWLVAGVLAASLERKEFKEIIDKTFEKYFGKAEKNLENTFEKQFGKEQKEFKDESEKTEEKEESLFKIPTLKPPTHQEDK